MTYFARYKAGYRILDHFRRLQSQSDDIMVNNAGIRRMR